MIKFIQRHMATKATAMESKRRQYFELTAEIAALDCAARFHYREASKVMRRATELDRRRAALRVPVRMLEEVVAA